jgi:hypothetical protein
MPEDQVTPKVRGCEVCGAEIVYNHQRTRRWNERARWCRLECYRTQVSKDALNARHTTRIRKFWGLVAVRDASECWLWSGQRTRSKYRKTYGKFYAGVGKGMVYAHRYAYELTNGQIPDGLFVCHTCDVCECVNPSHLFLGTIQDNVTDMTNKRRHCYGERVSGAILNRDMVLRIRELRGSGMTYAEIGRSMGIKVPTVGLVIRGGSWRHIQADAGD